MRLILTAVTVLLNILMAGFSLVFKIAQKTRLTIPLIAFLAAVISTFFTDWVTRHEMIVFIGLGVLLAGVGISWIVTLVRFIRKGSVGSDM